MSNEMIPLITYLPNDNAGDRPGKGLLGDAIAGKPSSDATTGKGIGRVEVSSEKLEAQMTQLLKGKLVC